jgi:AcrR family transcriptional regulator
VARYRVGLETRERILAATRRVIIELGIEGVTLKAILDQANLGAGSFYNLFESKEDAVLEVVAHAITAVDPDPAGVGLDSLEDLVDAFVTFFTDSRPIARIYLQLALARGLTDRRVAEHVHRSHRRRVERFADAWSRLAPGIDEAEAEARAELLVAALMGLGLHALVDPSFDLRGLAARLLPPPTGTDVPVGTNVPSLGRLPYPGGPAR